MSIGGGEKEIREQNKIREIFGGGVGRTHPPSAVAPHPRSRSRGLVVLLGGGAEPSRRPRSPLTPRICAILMGQLTI